MFWNIFINACTLHKTQSATAGGLQPYLALEANCSVVNAVVLPPCTYWGCFAVPVFIWHWFWKNEDSGLFELEQSLCCWACSRVLGFPAVQQPLQILSPLCCDVLLQCQILWKASSGKCSRPVRLKPLCAAVEHVIMRVFPVHYFSAERASLSVLFCPSLSGCLNTPLVSWHLVYFCHEL